MNIFWKSKVALSSPNTEITLENKSFYASNQTQEADALDPIIHLGMSILMLYIEWGSPDTSWNIVLKAPINMALFFPRIVLKHRHASVPQASILFYSGQVSHRIISQILTQITSSKQWTVWEDATGQCSWCGQSS